MPFLAELVAIQRWIHDALTAELTSFAATHDWAALVSVLPAGIVFGAVHALTPGHSKGVLASYLLGSRLQALRASAVAAVLSLTHVGSAVVIALVATQLVTRTIVGAGRVPLLENLSRGLLLAIGAWLIWRAFRGREHPHGEGLAVGFVAGLIPCPLTLFVMVLAVSNGVPEAGVAFAAAMAIGVLLTLTAVAVATVLARGTVTLVMENYGASINRVVRVFDGLAGCLIVAVALVELAR